MATEYAQANVYPGAWNLPSNGVWNPDFTKDEQRFEYEARGPWSIICKLRGIAITLDGKVFGPRSLSEPKAQGYVMEGRVSIGGKKYRAFTSNKLFENGEGDLVDVGVLVVCGYEQPQVKE